MSSDAKPSIMIVDDEPEARELVRESIDMLDGSFEVIEARDGANAVFKLAMKPFDVLVTDINMPGADGSELIDTIAGWDVERRPKNILVISGSDRLEELSEKLPGVRVLPKPFDLDEIIKFFEEVFGVSTQRIPTQKAPAETEKKPTQASPQEIEIDFSPGVPSEKPSNSKKTSLPSQGTSVSGIFDQIRNVFTKEIGETGIDCTEKSVEPASEIRGELDHLFHLVANGQSLSIGLSFTQSGEQASAIVDCLKSALDILEIQQESFNIKGGFAITGTHTLSHFSSKEPLVCTYSFKESSFYLWAYL